MLIQIPTPTCSGDLAHALDQFDRLFCEYDQCCDDEVFCPRCQHDWRKSFDEQLKAGLVVEDMNDNVIQALKNFNRLTLWTRARKTCQS